MGAYHIIGGNILSGEIKVQGSKNSSLSILAATVLNPYKSTIYDVPDIKDISIMIDILRFLGAKISRKANTIVIDSSNIKTWEVPEYLMRKMRSSIILMGALLGRFGEVRVSYPGGCEIGPHPIDLHLKGLAQMGVNLQERHGFIFAGS